MPELLLFSQGESIGEVVEVLVILWAVTDPGELSDQAYHLPSLIRHVFPRGGEIQPDVWSWRQASRLGTVAGNPEAPVGLPDAFDDHITVTYDLMHLAIRATSAASFGLPLLSR